MARYPEARAVVEKRPPQNPIRYGTLHIPEGLLAGIRRIAAASRMSTGEVAAVLLAKGIASAQAEAAEQKGVSEESTEGTAPDTPDPSPSVSDPPAPP